MAVSRVALPLQPDLDPWPTWLVRISVVLLLSGLVIGLGVFGQDRQRPPELILSGSSHEGDYVRVVERLVNESQQRVFVLMYVVHLDDDGPVQRLMQALASAVSRGVQVRVALDAGKDRLSGAPDDKNNAAVTWLRAHQVPVILDEFERTSHSKILVIDGRWVVLGSHNWTRSAIMSNREASVLMDDRRLAALLEAELAGIPGWNDLHVASPSASQPPVNRADASRSGGRE